MSSNINEEKLIASLYKNFRGKKRKIDNWMTIAETVNELGKFYGSRKILASHLGVSNELIRETLKLLELPEEVQNIVRAGKLKHEVAWRIESVDGKKNQIKIAKMVVGLPTHDARIAVRLFRNNPDINIVEYIEKVKKLKNDYSISLIIVPLKKIDYSYLQKESIKYKTTPSKLLSDIIIPKWINRKKK